MKLGDLQSTHNDFYTPRFRVDVAGESFTEADGLLSDISVDSTLDGADRFSFTLNYPYSYETGAFVGLDRNLFAPGKKVVIWMGYRDLAATESTPLLVGRISAVKSDFPAGGAPTTSVSGYDLLHDITKGTDSESWDGISDSEAVRKRLTKSNYGFKQGPGIEETGRSRRKIVQDKESDYTFIKKLADRNGYEMFARPWKPPGGSEWHEEFFFRAPAYRSAVTLVLEYGDSLFSFSPERSDANQVNEVEVRYWDETRKKEIVGKAKRKQTGVGRGKRVIRRPVESKTEADAVAKAALESLAAGLVEGSGETVGLPELRVGERIEFRKVDTFANVYYISQVTHSIGGSGYRTSFQVNEPPPTELPE